MDKAVEEIAATARSSGGRGSVRLRGGREVGARGDGVGTTGTTRASPGAGMGGGDRGRGAACPDEDGAVCGAGDEEGPVLTAVVSCLVAEDATRGAGEDADGPDGIGVAIKRSFRIDAAAFPDPYAAVGATAEDPAIADGTPTVTEGLVDGRCGEAEDRTVVAAVCHLAFEIQVI